ncbi:hypothetical protein QYZ88_018160 [Lachnospiraceae bacterium C1.1]|nr:hypothetical protein [Lachnospiraceae bacterium C1.1]
MAEVSENGIIKAVGSGSSKITIYFGQGKKARKLKLTIKVKK